MPCFKFVFILIDFIVLIGIYFDNKDNKILFIIHEVLNYIKLLSNSFFIVSIIIRYIKCLFPKTTTLPVAKKLSYIQLYINYLIYNG